MYDFAAEPGNNELTVSEGEIITITNPVRKLRWNLLSALSWPTSISSWKENGAGDILKPWLPFPDE